MSDPRQDATSVSEALRNNSAAFTAADKKVVRALQDDYPRAGLESLPKLAARADVSAPTVLRLITKVGYQSYGDFQAALHDEVSERMSQPASRHRDAEESTAGDEVSGGVALLAESLLSTGERIDRQELKAVIELLGRTKQPVTTFGGFESEVCARHLATLLLQVRTNVKFQARGATSSLFEALDVKRNSVVIAFDFRRYQTSTLNTVKFVREHGATVVLFTDRWISPAADHADHVFVCDSKGVGPFDSRASWIGLIELIVAGVMTELGPSAEKRIESVYGLLAGSTWGEGLGHAVDANANTTVTATTTTNEREQS